MAESADVDQPGTVPAILLLVALVVTVSNTGQVAGRGAIEPKQVGIALFGPYLLGVELASILLLAGLVGAYHLARRDTLPEQGDRSS